MQEQKNNLVKRIIYASVMVIAASLLIFAHHEAQHGSNYAILHTPAAQLADSEKGSHVPADGIDEPLDINHVIHITLGGRCTPAAILGTNSFGSFNLTAEEEGAESFFSQLSHIFTEDNLTVLGCAAVLSDRELFFEEPLSEELPHLGPTKNAEVFSLSSVDILSLAHARAEVCGEEGLSDTREALEACGLSWTDSQTPVFHEIYGITVGVVGARIPHGTESDKTVKAIQAAAESCDYMILYAEKSTAPGEEDGEDDYYTLLAQSLIDAGCDLICYVGGGEQRGVETSAYGSGIIIDSLGSLLDGGSYVGIDTALYSLSLSVNDGNIEQVEGTVIPVVFGENPWIPTEK